MLLTLLVIVALFGAAVISCPDKAAHEEALQNLVKSTVTASLATEDDAEGLIPLMSYIAGGLSSLAFQGILYVDNYFVCSVGSINYDGNKEVVTFGVFNHVFTVPNKELRQRLEQDFK